MSEPKRYFWLKLHKDFFQRKEIKRLRKIAGGDTYTIIYLKMLLRSIMSDGKLYFDGLEDDFASELALDLDEKEENVQITIQYLLKSGLLEMCSDEEYYLPDTKDSTGCETAVAVRVRRHREKQKALQCNTDVTQVKHLCNGEIEKELEKEKELDKEIDNKCASTKQKRKRFVKPTISDIKQYCSEKNISINAQQFIDYYESNGWKVGRNSMKDWQATVRRWASNNYGKKKSSKDNAINVVNNLMSKLGGDGNEQSATDTESTIDVTASVHY
ncbi:MAG: phage replisome organizer N-terminal domain-containing protein [Clostridium sp.]|uniref:phage replisome organizer N-terminal domain-containing protein n=1 Tax=Veillonella sp. TaxID=1926307 RepID=UPI0029142B23|nr:phage replisome organizer N-terminal domain-containing protein [Veillonella sp.]MDU6732057.1 phage replisome organizer N-terminal domain-containing protein [Staphylococcus epidermidis]MDU6787950.1 phage replisome organizer N-terminal domain-containing protein [Veillonella sp.]MDU6810481.1 phage replisome organizer N-terminal domain-containing protein [Clostridium sp.]MDU6817006.1 phage replisome organizer N-terminal domain-containing protein [Veillonella sp.]